MEIQYNTISLTCDVDSLNISFFFFVFNILRLLSSSFIVNKLFFWLVQANNRSSVVMVTKANRQVSKATTTRWRHFCLFFTSHSSDAALFVLFLFLDLTGATSRCLPVSCS